jgi:hypothetical protein
MPTSSDAFLRAHAASLSDSLTVMRFPKSMYIECGCITCSTFRTVTHALFISPSLHPASCLALFSLTPPLPRASLPLSLTGESGLVASGISSYELCRRSLKPVARHAACPPPCVYINPLRRPGPELEWRPALDVEGGGGGGGGLCSRCKEEGRMVERSVTTVEGCSVRECGEEGLWAAESALLIWSDCQVSVCALVCACVRACVALRAYVPAMH